MCLCIYIRELVLKDKKTFNKESYNVVFVKATR